MIDRIETRDSTPADLPDLEALYPAAFPNEDLLPLVRTLLQEEPPVLSLVAEVGGVVVGHVAFTPCRIEGQAVRVDLLAPLAVAPAHQRQGIGSTLVRAGLRRLASAGVARALVLGDPAYYSRFGFVPDRDVEPPYPLPPEWAGAWQSIVLDDADPPLHGRLSVPESWRQPALWGP